MVAELVSMPSGHRLKEWSLRAQLNRPEPISAGYEDHPIRATERRRSGRKALIVTALVLLAMILGGALTVASRVNDRRELAKETEALAIPNVSTVHATVDTPDGELQLPGTVRAFAESPIYARTNGYLRKWYHDIGSHVKQGELLAEIETPEVDQELMQARAAHQQVEARVQLARSSAQRWQNLRASDSVSQQELDERLSAQRQAEADLAAADANVRRLEQLESFK